MYHPDLHPDQGKPFTTEELAYLCKFYGYDPLKTLALALGRTEQTITNKVLYLRRAGVFDYYRKKWDLLFEKADI